MKNSDCIKAFSISFLLLFIAGGIISILIANFYLVDGIHLLITFAASGLLSLILGLLNLLFLLPFKHNAIRFLFPGITGFILYLSIISWGNHLFKYVYLPIFNIFIGLYWTIRTMKRSDTKNPAKY